MEICGVFTVTLLTAPAPLTQVRSTTREEAIIYRSSRNQPIDDSNTPGHPRQETILPLAAHRLSAPYDTQMAPRHRDCIINP